jgi:CubicO group peptidase (beta-lactamase class C family)
VPILRILATVLVVVFAFGHEAPAQSLTYALFERFIDALRQQAGIPGMAAAIVRDGRPTPEWERGFGMATVEGAVAVTPDTPFPIAELTQSLGTALFLRHCIDSGEVEFTDLVRRWSPSFGEASTTFADALSHRSSGAYAYRPERFARALTTAVETCGDGPYAVLAFDQIINRFGMVNTVPGGDVAVNGSPVRLIFPVPLLRTFTSVLNAAASAYRVDSNRRATRSIYRATELSAGDGLVASVHDMARFEAALDSGALVRRETLATAWVRQPGTPRGLGWFVQQVNGRRVVWQFGRVRDAYSSLVVKVPDAGLTLILLANSDGLTAPFPLENGDITVSPFANIFFSLLS